MEKKTATVTNDDVGRIWKKTYLMERTEKRRVALATATASNKGVVDKK